ncbi:hypothetical protein [Mycolicibacterium sediminis]|uniref:Tetratricopeptide repeat protein n=1 Tax=Mycolicibacterium sediminis TaxID=1286180 RepID=A0A7I7QK58_9MYCO|nr:hypothetical protein [Mycolicibacterium sediminis]BBY26713.1 hypothetical protein MSEDJ_08090 [Mycolicibacterium sediminis]
MRNVGRTRLLLWSAPVVVLVLLIVAKLTSMALAGGSAVEDYQRRDVEALRDDVSTMQVLDVVDPYSTAFAAGSLAVLEGRLEDAEEHFATAVAHDATCPALTNLALVAETRGDQFVGVGDGPGALGRYRSALATVTGGPARCFAEPDEPDAERRDVLTGSAQRLNGKIALLERPLPPPPPPAAPPPPPPGGAPPPTAGSNRDTDDQERILLPGDPLDQLRQLLEDAAATRGAP